METLGQDDLSIRDKKVIIISQDSFYRDLTKEQRDSAAHNEYNFDHPGRW